MKDDRALFEAWCDGDRAAGSELFDRHYEPLARFFHNKVDEASSADLVQRTFLACTEGRERFRREAGFRTYLFGIAHNLLRKHYQRRRADPGAIDFDEACVSDLAPSVSTLVRGKEEQRLLLAALRGIPIDCQEVLELHYWEQMGTSEIGEIVGVPEGTVKSRLQRGRRLLESKIRALASSGDLLQSTLDNLDRWAADLRERVRGDGP
ncbi:MAG: sigma-70 family RNA polymerase sigma factor [Minicystis sp.]